MQSFKVLVILTTILMVSFTDSSVKGDSENMSDQWKHSEKYECICPNTTVSASTAEERKNTTILVATVILNIPIPNLSMLGNKYQGILKEMITSPKDLQYVVISTTWLSTHLPFLSLGPSGCPMAQLINATVACLDDHDVSKMASALDIIRSHFTAPGVFIDSSIAAAGCEMSSTAEENTSTNTIPKYDCFKNGFVYDIEDAWYILGSKFPHKLRETVMKMYKSRYYLDNLLAVIATFSLMPTINNFFVNWPFGLAFEAIALQSSGPIPKCCCKERVRRIIELGEQNNQQSAIETQKEKDIYASKSACRPKLSKDTYGMAGGAAATISVSGKRTVVTGAAGENKVKIAG